MCACVCAVVCRGIACIALRKFVLRIVSRSCKFCVAPPTTQRGGREVKWWPAVAPVERGRTQSSHQKHNHQKCSVARLGGLLFDFTGATILQNRISRDIAYCFLCVCVDAAMQHTTCIIHVRAFIHIQGERDDDDDAAGWRRLGR